MLLGVGLTFLALRAGLGLRRRRQQGAAKVPGSLARHLALARPAVLLGALGLLWGPFEGPIDFRSVIVCVFFPIAPYQ